MNDDDKNLNPNPEMQAWIEPELEARVVAWVAGEASAFEIAELERLMAEKPELAIFKRRIEAVHGLVGEAMRPDAQPLRMSAERRAKLLATIGGAGAATRDEKIAVLPLKPRQSWWRSPQIYFAASGLAAAALIVIVIAPGQFSDYKRAAGAEREAKVLSMSVPLMLPVEGASDDTRAMPTPPFRQTLSSPQALTILAEKPARPDPVEERGASERILAANVREAQATGEPIVKLDAFTVSEPRDAGYAAAVSAGSYKPVITVPGLSADIEAKDKKVEFAFTAPPTAPVPSGGTLMKKGSAVADAGGLALGVDADANARPRTDGMRSINSTSGSKLAFTGTESGASAKPAEFDQLSRANPFDNPAAPALANKNQDASRAVGFSDRIGFVETNTGAVSPPVGPVTFGGRTNETAGAKSIVGADGSVTLGAAAVGGALSAAPAPANEPIKLEAFTISAPKKSAAKKGPAASVPLVARRSPAPGDQEKQVRDLAEREAPSGDGEISAAQEAVSTFSLHVSDVSFRLAVASIAAMERGETSKSVEVRAEEFYNAFDYGDPATAVSEKISARIEQSAHPVLQQRNLVRIALKVPSVGRGAGRPLRLTVLLDTSGSMEREDRRLAVRRALEELIALLGPNDRVTLIGFARQPRLLAEAVAGNQAGHLVELSARTPAEGGTNLEEALKLAGQLALRHKLDTAQNRIVLLTDGAANLGNADPARLAQSVEALRQQRIAFDACGIGLEGVGDVVLEALTRKGDGRYYVVDRPETADASFARQLAGAFRPAAENVKLQVRFNPARVGNYRLVGFEQHRLREEDFRNDKVDAAELAADEGANAVYQVEVLPQGSGEIGEVFVRFRDPSTGAMVERSWTISYDPRAPRFDRASPSLQLAGIAALITEKLNETPMASQFKLGDFAAVVNSIKSHYSREPRVQELVTMFGRMRRLSGE
jgi:Ca-activated chloride channel family protein